MSEILLWLQSWYDSRINGDWEHSYGITIQTLDNPGWKISIDLADTYLHFKSFTPISYDNSPLDWLNCWVADRKFEAACAVPKLITVLQIFKDWAEDGKP